MSPISFVPASDPLAIVSFAFEHRFVTAAHVQRVFGLNSYRTAQHQVQQLVRQGLLADVPVYRTLNSFPNVYVATGRGVTRLARKFEQTTGRRWQSGGAEQRRRGRPRRLTFIEHELDTTDVDIRMMQFAASRADLSLLHIQRRYDRRGSRLSFYDADGAMRTIAPDAGYHLHRGRPGGQWLDLCFLEMDRGSMPWGTRIVQKLAAYEAWAASETGERYLLERQRTFGDPNADRGMFRLLMIARTRPGEGSDANRLTSLIMAALPRSHAMRRRLWLTTWEALTASREDEPLGSPIWLWGKDIADWRDAYSELDQRLPRGVAGERQRRGFVAERLAAQPRRRLFKSPPAALATLIRPHERERLEPDNSIMLPSWDGEGPGASVGEWRRTGG